MAITRRFCFAVMALAWLGCAAWANAEAVPAHVTLGQAAAPLYGPWKFTVGDSPIDPGNPPAALGRAGFDDSKWETVDLTPKDGGIRPLKRIPGYVPGWTAKGHPGYFGYAWYRIRVQVQARPGARWRWRARPTWMTVTRSSTTGSWPAASAISPAAARGLLHPAQDVPLAAATSRDGERQAESTRVLAFRLWMEPYPAQRNRSRAASHRRRCWARRARWRPATRCAGWNWSAPTLLCRRSIAVWLAGGGGLQPDPV